ncbi:MAG: YfiR family protein [Thermodesulfobacteriota bacterium]
MKLIRPGILFFWLLLLVCPVRTLEAVPLHRNTNAPSEQELKAIYLYNFLQFVNWPQEKCPLPNGHAREIVVIGRTSLREVLQALQAKLHEQNQELNLVFHDTYHEGLDLSRCCLLFIAASEKENLPAILAGIEGRNVLTVTDTGEVADAGVMITLLLRENRIRWAINRKPVAEAGLKMNAKLLEIAERVVN